MSPTVVTAIEAGRDELTHEEARAFAEEQTQEHFGLSVEEFAQRAADGTLPEDDPVVVHLALLIGVRLHSC